MRKNFHFSLKVRAGYRYWTNAGNFSFIVKDVQSVKFHPNYLAANGEAYHNIAIIEVKVLVI